MIHFLVYLLEVSICLFLFHLIYSLLLRRETFHKLKRIYLLVSVILSLMIPILPSIQTSSSIEEIPVARSPINQIVEKYSDSFEKVVLGRFPVQDNADSVIAEDHIISFLFVLSSVYMIGLLILVFNLVRNIYQILKLVRENRNEPAGRYTIVHHKNSFSNFSFFKYIFLSNEIKTSQDKTVVLNHERIHVNLHHSYDIIFIESCKILMWFNPVIWFLKKSLIKVHECQVDKYLIDTKEVEIDSYQHSLLNQYLGSFNMELGLAFNYSMLDFRMKMMKKSSSKWWTKFKLLLVIPVITFGLMAFSKDYVKLPDDHPQRSQKFRKLNEPPGWGMVFIRGGSFVLNRTDGISTKEFNVTIDDFWMRETEVYVYQYSDYLETIKKDSTRQIYEAALPDPSKAPFKGYFDLKKYRKYPMVGISFTQAKNYCKWLSDKENERLAKKRKPPVAEYRLPTELEWTYVSLGALNPDYINHPPVSPLSEIVLEKTNKFFIIDLYDNVSEWTSSCFDEAKYMQHPDNTADNQIDNIIVKGKNYKNSMKKDKLVLNGNESYDYVGLRYVRTYLGDKYGKN